MSVDRPSGMPPRVSVSRPGTPVSSFLSALIPSIQLHRRGACPRECPSVISCFTKGVQAVRAGTKQSTNAPQTAGRPRAVLQYIDESADVAPAVDSDGFAGDEVRVEQERYGFDDFVFTAPSAERR